ncbi:MAG: cytochrome C [Ignavibacteriales bacterium]|nr:cytochrome C [Ignavibacteriales bacterium]
MIKTFFSKITWYLFFYRLIFFGFITSNLFAQFSPGDLSNSHRQLEGSENCTNCHEVGTEISGAKCISCHLEIQLLRKKKHGYHGITAVGSCVECHKEHLGRESKTVLFEESKFDHVKTGFTLSGKHSSLGCSKCHSSAYRKDTALMKILEKSNRKTYLGLTQTCYSCHSDPHKDKFGKECSSCHTSAGWKNVNRFDHTRTKFPLIGKHQQVKCDKCHPSMNEKSNDGKITLIKNDFADCKSCHQSPHNSLLNEKICSSCHAPVGWADASNNQFNHDFTRYKLTGMHKEVRCEKCHPVNDKQDFKSRFKRDYNNCTDCHIDKHDGVFLSAYKNDCSVCHSLHGFKLSTYPQEKHNATHFPLTGAHAAVPCNGCHRKKESEFPVFRFTTILCESCHKDIHAGAFTSMMKEKSCGNCHITTGWRDASFDHSTTAFPLTGRHKNIGCAKCHKSGDILSGKVVFQKIPSGCESCHADAHAGQFIDSGKTDCFKCHTAEGWKLPIFNHETQSKFKLTGKHLSVTCSSCHKTVKDGKVQFIRFKPLETSCESCHQKGIIQ